MRNGKLIIVRDRQFNNIFNFVFLTLLPHHAKPPFTAMNSYQEGQKVMGRTGHALGILSPGSPEDIRHRGFFGVSAEVAVKAWNKMGELDLLPTIARYEHYLWALAFMRTYPPNESTLSLLLGGKDPKTIHKYMWPYIQSLAELENVVVSLCFVSCSMFHNTHILCHTRLILKTGKRETY